MRVCLSVSFTHHNSINKTLQRPCYSDSTVTTTYGLGDGDGDGAGFLAAPRPPSPANDIGTANGAAAGERLQSPKSEDDPPLPKAGVKG